MYGLLCKRLLLVRPIRIRASKTLLGFLQFDDTSVHFIRSCSSSFNKRSSEVEKDKQQQSFAVSYLINSCGLSLESAISTSEKVNLQTPEKPESVLSLLRNHGFSKTHISKVVRDYPRLLFANPEKTLLPKLDFFYSIGVSSTDVPEILSRNPSILMISLEKSLIPAYNFLKSAVPDERVIVTFTRCLWRSPRGAVKKIASKIASLRDLGVPESVISYFITCYPTTATGGSENFNESLKKVIKMGFNPSKTTFILAVQVICQMTKSTWEHKMRVYRRLGLSEDEVWMAFKAHPQCMKLSEKKIVSTMDYLVIKMGWQPAAIARDPRVLFFNLEKRIIPRCLVIKVLVLKSLIKKDRSLSGFLNISEKHFLEKFVTKYQEEVPQLLNVYEGKMGLLDLGFGSAEICGMKQL